MLSKTLNSYLLTLLRMQDIETRTCESLENAFTPTVLRTLLAVQRLQIEDHGPTPGDVAKLLGVTPQAAAKNLYDGMVADVLIPTRDPTDKRLRRYTVSAAGMIALSVMEDHCRKIAEEQEV